MKDLQRRPILPLAKPCDLFVSEVPLIAEKTAMRKFAKEIIIFGSFTLIVAAYFFHMKRASPNQDGAKLSEVQRLATQTPVFPPLKDQGSTSNSGLTSADFTKYFYSTATYSDVKQFYSDVLKKDGWIESNDEDIGVNGKQVTFRREEFSIVIFYTGNQSATAYNYAIDFVWHSK